jgi:integrase
LKRARHQQGSVVFNKRSKTWHFLWNDSGTRRSKLIGSLREVPTKAAAWGIATRMRDELLQVRPTTESSTLSQVAQGYQTEKLPSRAETARVYRSWLKNHILPRWGSVPIKAIQPREVELWLRQLQLAPKTRSHIRNLFFTLIEYAIWSGRIELARNPIGLVEVKGGQSESGSPVASQWTNLRSSLRT